MLARLHPLAGHPRLLGQELLELRLRLEVPLKQPVAELVRVPLAEVQEPEELEEPGLAPAVVLGSVLVPVVAVLLQFQLVHPPI